MPWPSTLLEQFQSVRAALATLGGTADAATVVKSFRCAPRTRIRIEHVLDTLAGLGFIRRDDGGTSILVDRHSRFLRILIHFPLGALTSGDAGVV